MTRALTPEHCGEGSENFVRTVFTEFVAQRVVVKDIILEPLTGSDACSVEMDAS